MKITTYVLGPGGIAVPERDIMRWGKAFGQERHVALTEIGDVRISTVFLGIDHNFSNNGPPILWETMVFGGDLDDRQWRYSSQEDALKGHDGVVATVERLMTEGKLSSRVTDRSA